MVATRKEDCGFLMIALIPPGNDGAAQRAMAAPAPDGTLFVCDYVDEVAPDRIAEFLEAAKHAFRYTLEQREANR